MTLHSADLLTPHRLDCDQQSYVLAAVSWALRGDVDGMRHMHANAEKLSHEARVEVLTCLTLLADTLRGLECRDVAAALVVAT